MSYRHVSVTQSRPESRLFPALSVSNSPLKCWDDTWHITISRPGPDYPHRPWATLALHLYQGPSTFANSNHHTWAAHVRFEKSALCHNKQFIDRVTLLRTKSLSFYFQIWRSFNQHDKSWSEDTFSCLSQMTRVIFVIRVPGTDTLILILQFYLNTRKYEDTLSWNQISLSAGFPQFPCFMLRAAVLNVTNLSSE